MNELEQFEQELDQDIDFLTNDPISISRHWANCSPLFRTVGSGCLTQIRQFSTSVSYTPELTSAIRADERIPKNEKDITIADLPVFKEWQLRARAEKMRLGL